MSFNKIIIIIMCRVSLRTVLKNMAEYHMVVSVMGEEALPQPWVFIGQGGEGSVWLPGKYDYH